MNYNIFIKGVKSTSKAGQYEDSVITLCGPTEVRSNMVNLQENMQGFFTCSNFVRSLSCYVVAGYGNPYKHLQICL